MSNYELLSNLSQRWVNYFPPRYVARTYVYSVARRWFNSMAYDIERQMVVVGKNLSDRFVYNNTGFDLDRIYNTQVNFELNTSVTGEVLGSVGSSIVESVSDWDDQNYNVVPIYVNEVDMYQGYYLDPPQYYEMETQTKNGFYFFVTPTDVVQECTSGFVYMEYEGVRPSITVYRIIDNMEILRGLSKKVEIEGYRKDSPHSVYREAINIGLDGTYNSKYEWIIINKFIFTNLRLTNVEIKSFSHNLLDRGLGYLNSSDNRMATQKHIKWDETLGRFIVYRKKYNSSDGLLEDPDRVLYVSDGVDIYSTITDFAFEPLGRHLYVLMGTVSGISYNKLMCYSLQETIPSACIEVNNIPTTPYNVRFEYFDANSISIAVENKFIKNPCDYRFILGVVKPDNSTALLSGNLMVEEPFDPNKFYTYNLYMQPSKYVLPMPGIYRFVVRYFDPELNAVIHSTFIFNHEILYPIKTFNLPLPSEGRSYKGLALIHKKHLKVFEEIGGDWAVSFGGSYYGYGITSPSGEQVLYRDLYLYTPMVLYSDTVVRKYLSFIDVVPSYFRLYQNGKLRSVDCSGDGFNSTGLTSLYSEVKPKIILGDI